MPELPLISIAIPIFYGEIFLEDTLRNILEQDYPNIEIIITDNNPGGEPEKVAQKYASNHANIKYIQHPVNKGALDNWNSLVNYANGEYFIYAGAHDLWSDGFLSELFRSLQNNPGAVLAYAPAYWLEEPLSESKISTGFFDTSGNSLVQRFNTVFWGPEEALYGLMLMEAVNKSRLQAQIIGSGAAWLAELCLSGDFIIANGIQRYRRKNRSSENRHKRLKRYHKTLFKRSKQYWLPYWKCFFYYLSVPFMGHVSFGKRIQLFLAVLGGFLIRYFPDMLMDIGSIFRRIVKKY